MSEYRIETKCIQEGYKPGNGDARVMPIYQSTTFKYDSSEHIGKLFDLTEAGPFYTRLANPSVGFVEEKIAALEGGIGAMCTASGQSATTLAILNIAGSGDHIICSSEVYGGTFNLVAVTMKKVGIDVTFVNPDAPAEEIAKEFRPNTKAVLAESIANPALTILDFEKFATLAHSHNVPLIVDNTFPTPINCRPFEFGADIVIHATTKYMDGHACSLGGCIVDSGNFDWTKGDFPGLTTPDDSYHGVIYTRDFGKAAYITKARTQLMRDIGPMMSPQNAFLLNIGLETLHLRMPRHCENALKVATYLKNHPKIAWVTYPGLPDSPYKELVDKEMPNGTCGVISVGIKGGREAATRFMDSLKMTAIVVHVADARTCVLHPASTTHRQLSEQQLIDCGIRPEMVRLSIGIENAEDIIEDFEQALQEV